MLKIIKYISRLSKRTEIMVFLDDGHMCDTIIDDNTDPSSNNNLECRDLVLSYLHIGDKKYRILWRKIETDTNITINNMTERTEYNTIMEVTDE